MSGTDPRADYARRAAENEAARDDARRASIRIGTARLLTFLALAAAFVVANIREGRAQRVAIALAVVLAGAFIGEVRWHRRLRRREAWHETLRALAYEGILRVDRRWHELDEALPAAERIPETPDAAHAYARDLDLLGVASLVRLLGPVTSEPGRAELRRWLLEPSGQAGARSRQDAVRELAPRAEVRAILAAHGRIGALPRPQKIEPFHGVGRGSCVDGIGAAMGGLGASRADAGTRCGLVGRRLATALGGRRCSCRSC